MKNTIKHLEKHYGVNVEDILSNYENGESIKGIASNVGIGEMPVRTICAVLNLRFKQKHRENDLKILRSRIEKSGDNSDIVEALTEDLEILQHEVQKSTRTIQQLRDSNSVLRRSIRNQVREEHFYDLLKEELKYQYDSYVSFPFIKEPEAIRGTTVVMFSDIHYNEIISKDITNGVNVVNNNICRSRLDRVFRRAVTVGEVTEEIQILFLGDLVNGLIHLGQFTGEVPPMQSVIELAGYFTERIKGVQKIYEKVSIRMVSGNHSRVNDAQKAYHKAWDLEYVFYNLLKSNLPDVSIEYSLNGYMTTNIQGHDFGLFHGDQNRGYNGDADASAYRVHNIIENLYGVRVKSLLSGHTHRAKVTQNQFGGFNIVNGCASGINEYGLTGGFDTINPSQTSFKVDYQGNIRELQIIDLRDINE